MHLNLQNMVQFNFLLKFMEAMILNLQLLILELVFLMSIKIIFSEFRQVDGSTSRKYGGAGLGLSICKKYIELLGGVLMLQSELGKGSKFSFSLPDSVLDIFDISEHQFLTLTEDIMGHQPVKTILIINANPDSLKLIGDYLASYNYRILATSKALME